MPLKVKILFLVFCIGYLCFHFYSLYLNPIPWFDEVYFASISKTFLETGKFIPVISKEMWNGEEVLIHGPIHFMFGSTSFHFFGFGMVQYRFITFFFGILILLASASVLKFYHPSWKNICLLIIIFSLDPFFQLSLHEGRMDLTAVFFMLCGILFLLHGLKNKRNIYFFLSGMMIVISLLTTPRPGFIFIVIVIVLMVSLEGKIKKGSLLKLALWGLPLLLFYGLWIFYKFGSIENFFEYYQMIRNTKAEYIGGNLYIPRQEYLLIALAIASVIYGIIKRKLHFFNEMVIISILSIILFYIIVFDFGPYSMLILPFYYFLFFHGFSDLKPEWKNLSMYAYLLLFIFNLSFSALKAAQILSERESRDPDVALEFIQKNIPPGSRVIGDGSYYYAVIRSGSDHRLYQEFLSLEEREKLLREVYDYDYMIVTEISKNNQPEVSEYYLKKAELVKVAELKLEQAELSRGIAKTGLVSDMERSGYSATIYARIKKDILPVAEITQK